MKDYGIRNSGVQVVEADNKKDKRVRGTVHKGKDLRNGK